MLRGPVRSWVIAGIAGGVGLGLWVVDNIGDDHREMWVKELVHTCEFVVFVPLLTLGAFALSERLRSRTQMLHDERVRARQERLAALGVVAAGIAHEVRNPLHSLRLMVDELQHEERLGEAHPRLRRHLERIDKAVALAYHLIGSGDGTPAPRQMDLAAAVREVLDERAAGGPQPIDAALPANAPVAAGEALVIIIANLLANAVTAVADGAGRVQVAVAAAGPHTTLTVRNPGTLPVQLDPSLPRSVESSGGLGLGLFICHQLAPGMGARLTIAQSGPLVEAVLTLPTWNGTPP